MAARWLAVRNILIPPIAGKAVEMLANAVSTGKQPAEHTVTASASLPPLKNESEAAKGVTLYRRRVIERNMERTEGLMLIALVCMCLMACAILGVRFMAEKGVRRHSILGGR